MARLMAPRPIYHTETHAPPFRSVRDQKLIQVLLKFLVATVRLVTLQTITGEPGEKACASDMGGTLTAGPSFEVRDTPTACTEKSPNATAAGHQQQDAATIGLIAQPRSQSAFAAFLEKYHSFW